MTAEIDESIKLLLLLEQLMPETSSLTSKAAAETNLSGMRSTFLSAVPRPEIQLGRRYVLMFDYFLLFYFSSAVTAEGPNVLIADQ